MRTGCTVMKTVITATVGLNQAIHQKKAKKNPKIGVIWPIDWGTFENIPPVVLH